MSSTNENEGISRYPLPGVPTPILPADIANKAYVDISTSLLGSDVLAAPGDLLTVTWIPIVEDVVFVAGLISSGVLDPELQWNGIVTGTYDWRRVFNGSGDFGTNDNGVKIGISSAQNMALRGFISKISGEVAIVGGKTGIRTTNVVDFMGTEDATTDITSLQIQNIGVGDFDTDSYLKVFRIAS